MLLIFSYLIFSSFQLVENRFGFGPDVQLGWIVDQKYDVRSIDEPLTRVVKRKQALYLLAYLQNSRNFDDVYLIKRKNPRKRDSPSQINF